MKKAIFAFALIALTGFALIVMSSPSCNAAELNKYELNKGTYVPTFVQQNYIVYAFFTMNPAHHMWKYQIKGLGAGMMYIGYFPHPMVSCQTPNVSVVALPNWVQTYTVEIWDPNYMYSVESYRTFTTQLHNLCGSVNLN